MESKGEWDEAIRDKCFGSPGPLRGMKRFTYEGGHRVPGIIRWPGNAPVGVTSDVLINGTDILPTICSMLNIEIPSDRTIDGENMLEAFRGGDQLRRNPVVWSAPVHEYEFVPPMILREGDYLLVGFFNKKESGQLWMDWIKTSKPESYALYNLKEDIAQQNNIADKKPELVKELSAKMDQMWLDLQADSPVWPNWKAK